jgi:putative membrane protein
MFSYFLIFVMTFMGALASVFLKKAASSTEIVSILTNISLYIGLFLYGGAALINIVVLKTLDYSVVLPLTAITYIWTMVLSYALLKENISKKKIIGVGLILIGAIFVVVR